MSFPTRGELQRRRNEISLGASLATHALFLWLVSLWPEPAPPAPVLEVALVQRGEPEQEPGPPEGPKRDSEPQPAAAPPSAPRPPRRTGAPPPAPGGQAAPAEDPGPPGPPPAPQEPPSFRDWQSARRSRYLPSGVPRGAGGGASDGNGALDVRGRDRCEPPPDRTFAVLYLMYDSSGSMSEIRRAQALSCAHQYAQAAMDRGAMVVVGNFARGTTFTGPTRSLFEVQAALRDISDASATLLPSRELQPFLDRDPGIDSELVIVSDGMFPTDQDVLTWYRYYLELNPENRGTMYTVGTPGYRPAVRDLRAIGFDVFMYEQIRPRGAGETL